MSEESATYGEHKHRAEDNIPEPLRPGADCGTWEVINAINTCGCLNVGDIVRIIDPDNSRPSNIGAEGVVIEKLDNSRCRVYFRDGHLGVYYAKYLRKLPEISFDEPKEYKPIPLIDVESEWISRFKKIADEMFETFKAKNADYGNAYADGFSRFGAVQLVSRIYEKYCRVENMLYRKAETKVIDESVSDTLTDMAVQCIILRMLLESQTV